MPWATLGPPAPTVMAGPPQTLPALATQTSHIRGQSRYVTGGVEVCTAAAHAGTLG
jgi:hypothetical protein